MTWTAYRIVLRLLTPLHVGAGQAGNVQRARPYVTGKALWGALTARITRDNAEWGNDYVAVGERVNRELALSYFYPTVEGEKEITIWPWDKKTDDKFAWRYLNTYAATALDYERQSAQDGSLHEVEFIAPRTRDGAQVYLIGYIFALNECALQWRDALPRLQLGGERTYGWGRVAVDSAEQASSSLFGQWDMALDSDRPILRAAGPARLLAHTLADDPSALSHVAGSIEPLIGRETRQADQHGREIERAQICWTPGSSVNAGAQVSITANGVWQPV
jgi:hypothetical protein